MRAAFAHRTAVIALAALVLAGTSGADPVCGSTPTLSLAFVQGQSVELTAVGTPLAEGRLDMQILWYDWTTGAYTAGSSLLPFVTDAYGEFRGTMSLDYLCTLPDYIAIVRVQIRNALGEWETSGAWRLVKDSSDVITNYASPQGGMPSPGEAGALLPLIQAYVPKFVIDGSGAAGGQVVFAAGPEGTLTGN